MKPRAHTICHMWLGSTLITATNDGTTSPGFRTQHEDGNVSYLCHAETRAIQKAGKHRDVSNAKMMVMRVMANGKISMAKPCPHCQAFMWRHGIKARNVRFTNWDGEWERMSV